MEDELVFEMVLEAHDNVVPDCAHSILALRHQLSHTGVHVSVEMPAFNVVKVASLDRN